MFFLDKIVSTIKDFFESLFSATSPEGKKKHQLKLYKNELKLTEPLIYRPDGYLLPAFPASLHQLYKLLLPFKELMHDTLASVDKRQSEKYYDFLIELMFNDEQRAVLSNLSFAKRSESLISSILDPERVIEEQAKQFNQIIKFIDTPEMKKKEVVFYKLQALLDFCDFNYNHFFSYFDSAFSAHVGKETTVENPSFKAVEVVEILPSLLDLYYLLSNLDMNPSLVNILVILEAKRVKTQPTDEIKNKMEKLFQAVSWLLAHRVVKSNILAVVRIIKEDPEYTPTNPITKENIFAQYRDRKTEFFLSDSKKLLKEKQDKEIFSLIKDTFGQTPLEVVYGYNEETNEFLLDFSQFSLEYIHPLRIIKTFSKNYFIARYRTFIHSVIVEGYFNNRSLQSSISSTFFYCDEIPKKIKEFELLFEENHPCSIKVLKGYLTELEKGIDFDKPLRKMVDNMNGHAKAFVQQTVNQYTEIFNFCLLIIEDYKKTTPDIITNIRVLGSSAKNIESFDFLQKEIGVFRNFLEIMKKYAIVGVQSAQFNIIEQAEK